MSTSTLSPFELDWYTSGGRTTVTATLGTGMYRVSKVVALLYEVPDGVVWMRPGDPEPVAVGETTDDMIDRIRQNPDPQK